MSRKSQPKVNITLHLGFNIASTNTDSEHKLSGTTTTTKNAFKKYIKNSFMQSLEEEYTSFYDATISKQSAKVEVKDEGIDLTVKLTIQTSDSSDKVIADIKRVVQSIGRSSIDQEIIKDKNTREDFNVSSMIRIISAGTGSPASHNSSSINRISPHSGGSKKKVNKKHNKTRKY